MPWVLEKWLLSQYARPAILGLVKAGVAWIVGHGVPSIDAHASLIGVHIVIDQARFQPWAVSVTFGGLEMLHEWASHRFPKWGL